MKYSDIKNEHNEGANFFKKYLRYAELISIGDLTSANLVLQSLAPVEKVFKPSNNALFIAEELSRTLHEKGFYTRHFIGQSDFKCHIAIKSHAEDTHYIAGILIDDTPHYSGTDVMEQYLFRPDILQSNGWKIISVFAKDWYEDKERVIERVMKEVGK